MNMGIDWSFALGHIENRATRKGDIDILVEWANEAYSDINAVHINPDPASKSGKGIRTVGYSEAAGFHITIITFESEEFGQVGASAWRSNSSDIRKYSEGVRDDTN